MRASLSNPGDREAMIAHPDAIQLPPGQIAAGNVFVAELNGVVAGFAAVESRANGQSELDALFVDPKLQRRGIGRALVKHCSEFAHTRGCAVLNVVGNPHAVDSYIACGFQVTGTAQTRFGAATLMRMVV